MRTLAEVMEVRARGHAAGLVWAKAATRGELRRLDSWSGNGERVEKLIVRYHKERKLGSQLATVFAGLQLQLWAATTFWKNALGPGGWALINDPAFAHAFVGGCLYAYLRPGELYL